MVQCLSAAGVDPKDILWFSKIRSKEGEDVPYPMRGCTLPYGGELAVRRGVGGYRATPASVKVYADLQRIHLSSIIA